MVMPSISFRESILIWIKQKKEWIYIKCVLAASCKRYAHSGAFYKYYLLKCWEKNCTSIMKILE